MRTFILAFVFSSASACGGADSASRFVGKWIYQPGSAIVVDCPGAPLQTLDLSRVPPANQPGYFTFTESAAAQVHEVDARGCQYDWTVSGDVATAVSGQSCATFPDGHGGNRLVHLVSATKTTSDGVSIVVDAHFTSDDGCTMRGQGEATKS